MQISTDLHLVPGVTMSRTKFVLEHTRMPSWRAQEQLTRSSLLCVESAAETLRTFPYVGLKFL
jgi:hypothetical protein